MLMSVSGFDDYLRDCAGKHDIALICLDALVGRSKAPRL